MRSSEEGQGESNAKVTLFRRLERSLAERHDLPGLAVDKCLRKSEFGEEGDGDCVSRELEESDSVLAFRLPKERSCCTSPSFAASATSRCCDSAHAISIGSDLVKTVVIVAFQSS